MEMSERKTVLVTGATGFLGEYQIRESQAQERNDLNFYIKSKLMAERILRKWEKKGLETVILRPRGLIGIGDTSLVPRIPSVRYSRDIFLFAAACSCHAMR